MRVLNLKTSRNALLMFVAIALAAPLAGCGRKGALEAPEGARPANADGQGGAAQRSAGTEDDSSSAAKPPQRPFILDAIL